LAAPADNLAAQIIRQAGAGVVVGPDDKDGFINSVQSLLSDANTALEMGMAARAYAEQNFELGLVTKRFEKLLASVARTNSTTIAA
jgi:glycosyltransferase involved in cell wall biosynthesis